jgi:hypothetical protein
MASPSYAEDEPNSWIADFRSEIRMAAVRNEGPSPMGYWSERGSSQYFNSATTGSTSLPRSDYLLDDPFGDIRSSWVASGSRDLVDPVTTGSINLPRSDYLLDDPFGDIRISWVAPGM